jgi:hypothetical protein
MLIVHRCMTRVAHGAPGDRPIPADQSFGCAQWPLPWPSCTSRITGSSVPRPGAMPFCVGFASVKSRPFDKKQKEDPSEDASDAYHLAGWVRIHDDNHTGAYQLWAEGHEAVPECELLARQYRKQACWDTHDPAEVCNPDLLGNGAHGDGVFRPDHLEAFHVPEENVSQTPAMALFDSKTQKNSLVFRSHHHLMTAKECEGVLECVDTFHQDFRNGQQWGTVRHSSVKTTDVAVEDIPALRLWLRDLLRTRIYPLVAAAYPQLADGSTTGDMGSRRHATPRCLYCPVRCRRRWIHLASRAQ